MADVSDEIIFFISDKCRVPDHSIIGCEIIISDYKHDNSFPVRKKQLCNKSDCKLLPNMIRYKFDYNIFDNNICMCNENFNNDLQIISQLVVLTIPFVRQITRCITCVKKGS